ncbi:virulence factor lipase N-terminal [Balnearium lithotrophicum]|uniref:Virulence factor lipase N-terminal n=1 Tax=Balnearium lithotrophicum TaxID=223788 RepID=A0A521BUK3_9BACT|nr:hypothetical protein [Balnearium lithotrophicum]SMO50150.1 virulence factor lipase N-terminal [Balnearium lithotrophicum]
MKKLLALISVLGILSSCGGSLQSSSGAPDKINYQTTDRSYLVFDPFSGKSNQPLGIPFPNDILWSQGSRAPSYVSFDTSSITDPAKKVLFEAINKLQIQGLSPNTPIFIPLSSETPIDLNTLNNRYLLVDLTVLGELQQNPSLAGSLVQSDRLYVRQEGRYLKFYPVKPLEAGHKYLFILLDGIKDIQGKTVLSPQIYNEIEGKTPLSDEKLEALRQSYQYLYDNIFPAVSNLINVELNRNTVLESFTFTTANKTLSVSDISVMNKFLSGEINELKITGLPYSSIEKDYRTFDSEDVNKSPLYGVLKIVLSNNQLLAQLRNYNLFPAFDITKLGELFEKVQQNEQFDIKDYVKFIPVFFGNRDSYNGTVYIFQHGLGSSKERAENLLTDINLPVVAIDLPFHGDYTKLTENSSFECGEGKCYLTGNVARNRLNVYQSVFNLRLLELLLRNGVYDIDGDGSSDKVSHVYFLGVSMGAITGSIYSHFGSPEKVVLNVGGGNYVSIIDAAENELIEGLLKSTGVEKNTNGYAVLLGVFQMILDPADPVYLGIDNGTNVILQNACCDTVVPFISNRALSERVGFSQFTRLSTDGDFQNPPSSPNWYIFGDSENWVHHGFLIHTNLESYPEVQGHTTLEYVERAEKAARRQIESFFNGGQ